MRCQELSDDLLAELIYKKKIDILVDTSGMTRTNKLNIFKLKPVKKQISWAGWLGFNSYERWITLLVIILQPHQKMIKIFRKSFQSKRYLVYFIQGLF